MNAEQSNTTQAVKDRESYKNYPTDNPVAQTVQNGARASGQETETVSETSSAKQKREERMKKFDVEFETKMRIEEARFERRMLELDDRDKSPFNWTPKKRDDWDWASRIDNLLTPERSTARFEATPEVNRYSHFSRYRSSRDDPQVLKTETLPPELGYDTTMGTQVAVTYQSWSWTTSTENLSNGRSGLVCYSGSTTNTRHKDEPSEDSTDRHGNVSNLWNGLFWKVLWCCMELSGKEIWKTSCDHWCTAGESSQSKSGETSRLNRSDQFLSYCFELCECAHRVQADCWSAIELDTV